MVVWTLPSVGILIHSTIVVTYYHALKTILTSFFSANALLEIFGLAESGYYSAGAPLQRSFRGHVAL